MPSSLVGARLRALLAGTAIATGTVLAAAPAAHAAPLNPESAQTAQTSQTTQTSEATQTTQSTQTTQTTQTTARARFAAKADHVLSVVRSRRGDPYAWGATGPHRFDCSGLVLWTFHRALGRNLPRTAEEQKKASHRIWHRSHLRRGDLVFETNSNGYAYHVGIYAGNGYFWNAPHSGSHVKKERMYSARWRYGRIIQS